MNKLQLYFTGIRKDTCYKEGPINEVSLFPNASHNESRVLIGTNRKAKSKVSFIDTNEYRSTITLLSGQLDGAIKLKVDKSGNYKVNIHASKLTKHVPCVKITPNSLFKTELNTYLHANEDSVLHTVGNLDDDLVVEVGDAILYEVEIELIDTFERSIQVDFIYDGQLMNVDVKLKSASGINYSDFVHVIGNEDIAGVKSFSDVIKADNGIKLGNINIGELPSGELGIAAAGYVYSFSGTGTPMDNQDVATKKYVDDWFSSGCNMSDDQCAGIKANTDLTSLNRVVDWNAFGLHRNDKHIHLTANENAALEGSENPLTGANYVVDKALLESAVLILNDNIDNVVADLDNHTLDYTKHMGTDQNDAFDNANSPSASNPLATMNDIPAPAPPPEPAHESIPVIQRNIGGLLPTKIQCMGAASSLSLDINENAIFVIADTFGLIKPHYLVHYYSTNQEFYTTLMAKAV